MKQRRPDQNKLDAAKVFINEISQQSLEWAGGGQVPARKEIREGADFAELEVQSTLAQQVDALRFPPPVAGIGDALAPMNEAVNLAVLGKADPKQALDDAASQAAKILEENRKKYEG
jgi:multiple sugar transport system substrate-binding protein